MWPPWRAARSQSVLPLPLSLSLFFLCPFPSFLERGSGRALLILPSVSLVF
ncbi:hypothetical protein BRADI_2g57732v3 [Brachypodium distachyon]|uniref:Uncharacterized protein n=1 Tax=Brachypodium distachyon TaxID=15368 RepID=A0A2K2DGH8_BRADI|nr:hypothetical protein BRADI_2g57732v3 [Brachypodium distachyon]